MTLNLKTARVVNNAWTSQTRFEVRFNESDIMFVRSTSGKGRPNSVDLKKAFTFPLVYMTKINKKAVCKRTFNEAYVWKLFPNLKLLRETISAAQVTALEVKNQLFPEVLDNKAIGEFEKKSKMT